MYVIIISVSNSVRQRMFSQLAYTIAVLGKT